MPVNFVSCTLLLLVTPFLSLNTIEYKESPLMLTLCASVSSLSIASCSRSTSLMLLHRYARRSDPFLLHQASARACPRAHEHALVRVTFFALLLSLPLSYNFRSSTKPRAGSHKRTRLNLYRSVLSIVSRSHLTSYSFLDRSSPHRSYPTSVDRSFHLFLSIPNPLPHFHHE